MPAYARSAVTALLLFLATGAAAQNMRMGARYHIVDKDVLSVTTRYEDVQVTTARRSDGTIESSVRTIEGAAVGLPLVVRPAEVELIPVEPGRREPLMVGLQSLDAVNADRYLAWKRGRLHERELFADTPQELIDTSGPAVMRAAADDALSVTSVTNELEAFSVRGRYKILKGEEQPAFTSVLRRSSDQFVLVVMAWYSERQTLIFQTHWRQEPLMLEADQFENGWPFEPNLAWANIQMLSLLRSHEDEVARGGAGAVGGGGLRVGNLNTFGCDGLHWLDGGVLRPCCDIHDACYYKEDPDCSWTSWWFQGSWSCVRCNVEALLCMTMRYWRCSLQNICIVASYPVYYWDPPDPNCYITYGCACPAWCAGCGYYIAYDAQPHCI